MAEVAHPRFQRQIDEFAQLTQDDQVTLLADLCTETAWEDNTDLAAVFVMIANRLDFPSLAEHIDDHVCPDDELKVCRDGCCPGAPLEHDCDH
jgi:hypothetical protein